jgi:hypothetical protein
MPWKARGPSPRRDHRSGSAGNSVAWLDVRGRSRPRRGAALAAKASVTGSECRNGGSVKAKRGFTVRRMSSHRS